MLKYNIKIAIRNILRNKSFSIINILGLAMGMTCSLVMLLYVYEIYKADTFHENYNNLFLFQQDIELESGTYTTDRTGGATAPFLLETYPQIRNYTRVGYAKDALLIFFDEESDLKTVQPKSIIEKQGIAVDSSFLDVFTYPLIKGNSGSACQGNNFIVLTESLSNKLFGDEDPLGKWIEFNEEYDLQVTGIIKDVKRGSSLEFSYIVPFEVMQMFGYNLDGYEGTNFYSYLILNNPLDKEYINSTINTTLGAQYDETFEIHRYISHIKEAFLHGESLNFIGLYIFLSIGIGILLIASINYINLTTAKSFERAKEIGIRKTGGANKYQLISQFLGESLIISIIAIHLAILMVEISLPHINRLFELNVQLNLTDPILWLMLISIILFTGILAGLYPAFILSSLRPVTIMRDGSYSGKKGNRLRKILVVVQFSMTLFFIVSTVVLYRQFEYLQKADFGITREDIIFIPTRGTVWEKYNEIKNELLQESGILQVSTGSAIPNNVETGDIDWGIENESHNMIARIMWVGEDMDKTLDMELVHGKFYSKETPADNEDGIIVNEEVIRILGYGDNPIGRRFVLWDMNKKIIGVIKDYNFMPIDIGGKALILPYNNVEKFVFIKLVSGVHSEQITRVQNIFKKHNPNYPFNYSYLDDYNPPFFTSVSPLLQVLFYLCVFGIMISCLGLLGLAMYTTQKKTKEIGIRKAFGASVSKIIFLLTRQYMKLILLACIIALPLAILLMKTVLNFFTVKIGISTIFIIVIVIVMMTIAMLTILYHSIQAARRNPIVSLRYE